MPQLTALLHTRSHFGDSYFWWHQASCTLSTPSSKQHNPEPKVPVNMLAHALAWPPPTHHLTGRASVSTRNTCCDMNWWWWFFNTPKEGLTNCPAVVKTMTAFVFSVGPTCTSEVRLSKTSLCTPTKNMTYSKLSKKGNKKRCWGTSQHSKGAGLKWVDYYKAAMTPSYRANAFPVDLAEACKHKAEQVLGTNISIPKSVKHLPSPWDLHTAIPCVQFWQPCSMLSSSLHQLYTQHPLGTHSLEQQPSAGGPLCP